jgi:hypothetical protein
MIAKATVALLLLGSALLAAAMATPATAWAGSATSVTVGALRTITVTGDIAGLSVAVDASGAAGSTGRAVTLWVLSNAADGYTLSTWDRGLRDTDDPSLAISPVSCGSQVGVGFPAVGFGFAAALRDGGRDGATLADSLAAGQYVAYTTSPSAVLTIAAPTGDTPDELTLTNRVAVDSSVRPGHYTDVVDVVVTPNY